MKALAILLALVVLIFWLAPILINIIGSILVLAAIIFFVRKIVRTRSTQ